MPFQMEEAVQSHNFGLFAIVFENVDACVGLSDSFRISHVDSQNGCEQCAIHDVMGHNDDGFSAMFVDQFLELGSGSIVNVVVGFAFTDCLFSKKRA